MAAKDRFIYLLLALLIVNLFVFQGGIGQICWDGTKNRINADQIIDKIERGENVCYGPDSVIVGDLIFDKIKNKSIKGDIQINSDVYGKIIARNKIFSGLIDFNSCNFYKEVSFEGSSFLSNVFFYNSNFKKELSFEDVTFIKVSSFDGIVCDMSAGFLNASFEGDNTFYKATFNGRTDFSQCRFNRNGQFQMVNFKERSLFHRVDFKREASFFASDFSKDAEFYEAKFNGDAIFKSIKCDGALNFNDYPSLLLDGAEFSKSALFESSIIKYLNINNSRFSKNCKIYLNDCDFYRLNAKWDNIREHVPFDEEVFIHLFNYYKSVAQFNDADACYREYNYNSMQSALSRFFWLTSGFGTIISRTIIFLVLSSLFFALIYYLLKCIKKKDGSNDDLSVTDYIYFSLMVLINFSTDFVPVREWRWLVLIERLIGWILLAILIVTFMRLGLR